MMMEERESATRLEGWLEKEGHFWKSWKKRYFVLDKSDGMLTYYSDDSCTNKKGEYKFDQLSSVNVIASDKKHPNKFVLRAAGSNGADVLVLSASSEELRSTWLAALEENFRNAGATDFEF